MNKFEKIIYGLAILTACYGFWGVYLPEGNFLRGTCRVSAGEQADSSELYREVLRGEAKVVYSSRVWEWIKQYFLES